MGEMNVPHVVAGKGKSKRAQEKPPEAKGEPIDQTVQPPDQPAGAIQGAATAHAQAPVTPPAAEDESIDGSCDYTPDTRPLCQGMPFVLTDAAHPRLVLKSGSHFLVMDQEALIPACNTLGYGYYRYDTRHLSQYELLLNGAPLSLLSKAVQEGYTGTFLYTNPQINTVPQQVLTVLREVVLSDLLWERFVLTNFHTETLEIELTFNFQSDFADIFEVRGFNIQERGRRMLPVAGRNGRSIYLAYRGLDDCLVETVVEFFGIQPDSVTDGQVIIKLVVPPRQTREFQICFTTRWDGQVSAPDSRRTGFAEARKSAETRYRDWCNRGSRFDTSHRLFDLTLERSYRDLFILRQPTPKGYGISAGVPWYCALFGRDSAITAWQILPFLPDMARESIDVLAAYQGMKFDPTTQEEPGRILHELRVGELARRKAIPHVPYYGTIDATQLWLYVLCQYFDWSGDMEMIRRLWPAVRMALDWLSNSLDERGYLTYRTECPDGLINQGWKDSGDSTMHADGRLADQPIALCEPQAYLYAAWVEVARIAQTLGYDPLANKLRGDARKLKERFNRDFWMESEKFVALALDGHGEQCQVVSSNPGHCLFSGILDDDRAHLVADRLVDTDMHSGWGIRTLSRAVPKYNPMSYHNGSIWPHDNAIIVEGLRRIGRTQDAHDVLRGMLEAAQFEPDFRLPELFCGFDRNNSFKPIDYPVSCSPQAWAAGSMFQMLKVCLNMQPDALRQTLRIVEPSLPPWLNRVTLTGLRVGSAVVDLLFTAQDGFTACKVLHKSGKLKVIIES